MCGIIRPLFIPQSFPLMGLLLRQAVYMFLLLPEDVRAWSFRYRVALAEGICPEPETVIPKESVLGVVKFGCSVNTISIWKQKWLETIHKEAAANYLLQCLLVIVAKTRFFLYRLWL